jgi:hypothetical protein
VAAHASRHGSRVRARQASTVGRETPLRNATCSLIARPGFNDIWGGHLRSGRLVGLDPAAPTLNQAKARSDVDSILGDLVTASFDHEFELVIMTGHVLRVFITDDEIAAALTAVRAALAGGGRFAFETSNPRLRPWEKWTSQAEATRLPVLRSPARPAGVPTGRRRCSAARPVLAWYGAGACWGSCRVWIVVVSVSRMRRWLRPRDTSGHHGPRDDEGEPL